MATKNIKITKDVNIMELVGKYPQTAQILIEDYGMHCIGCMAASFETLEQGAKAHGMKAKQIEAMVKTQLDDLLACDF
jgi:hybrid cluster-associated redox disulfide protein